MKLLTAIALSGIASGAWSETLVDQYPSTIATKLSELRAAEEGAVSKLSGSEARYLFSRKRWTPGSTILVAFNGGSSSLHKAIAEQAIQWTKFANITLDFGFNPATGTYRTWSANDTERVAHIRIGFNQPGYWSFVGTDSIANFSPANAASMNYENFADAWPLLESRWKTVVIHEFGHALGLHHEHQHPSCSSEFRWQRGPNGEPSVYEVFEKWQGWTPQVVDVNLRSLPSTESDASKLPDKKSVMFYAMPAQSFEKGTASTCFIPTENPSISKIDALAAQIAYPKNPTQAFEVALAYSQAAAILGQKQDTPTLSATEKEALVSRINTTIEAKKPLLYIQIQRESGREKAKKLQIDARKSGFFVPGIENVSKKGLKSAPVPEIRYFRAIDSTYAESIASVMRAAGDMNVKISYVKSLENKVNRNLVEIWLP